jgi:hypothetical protein
MPRTKKKDSEQLEDKNSRGAANPEESAPAKTSQSTKASLHAESHAVGDPLKEATNRVAVGGKAEAMRAKLKAEPKVRVLVPLATGEKAGVTQSVILNGYSLYIRKGEYVDVPQSVAEVLEAKMKHKIAVDNHPLRADAEGGVKMAKYGQ